MKNLNKSIDLNSSKKITQLSKIQKIVFQNFNVNPRILISELESMPEIDLIELSSSIENITYELGKNISSLSENKILVTGASGGLGENILKKLGNDAIGVSLSNISNAIRVKSYSELSELEDIRNIRAIIHCAGPSPDNQKLTSLENPKSSIDHNICNPLEDIISLSKLLIKNGILNSSLIIIGSSFSSAGRHNWNMPLYSLSKSLIPNLTKILALELSRFDKKVIGVSYEMLDGGMNSNISNISKQLNSDRMLKGRLASIDEASMQIKWILDNPNSLISGSLIDCTGGAIP